MPKSLTISSDRSGFPEYLDFQKLREEGIRHIGRLSGNIWTDHNLHDPGITILEMLCYALTDLGYRTNFDIKDLLARRESGVEEDNFFTAAEILGCNPLTILDYRKLLIDIDGVRNAWLEVLEDRQTTPCSQDNSELVLIVDLLENKLKAIPCDTFDISIHRKIVINGLYRVYLELDPIRPSFLPNAGQAPVTPETIVQQVQQTLQEHRNFCEDFLDIVVLEDERISVCADLELTPEADPNEVLQRLYLHIQEFLSPSIQFYTLEEMLEKQKKPEEIFEGRPLLASSHGFIDMEKLAAMERRSELHISDLYQAILKDPQIRAIRNLEVSSDKAANGGQKWVLKLKPEGYRPVLFLEGSSIKFYKGPIPLLANQQRAKEAFENRLSNFKKVKLSASALDVAIPEGTFHDLSDYLSIQHEFPLVYGIGEGGLQQTETNKRKAQARQLQAYLTFFDQLLANYLAQLSNIRKLFSFKPNKEPQTYFTQPLLDNPQQELLIRFYNNNSNKDPKSDPDLSYGAGEIIARDPRTKEEIETSPEAREHIIRSTIRAFQDRTASVFILEDRMNVDGEPYYYIIKNLANDALLRSARYFKKETSALQEANALLLMQLSDDQFRRIDEDVKQESGDYIHRHSFTLAFRPNDYLSSLQMFSENETTFYERRNQFLDHLLGRFSEKFTDYVLLMYALDGGRRNELDIVTDKERFLQHYPQISRDRGRGFDYTYLHLVEPGQLKQIVQELPAPSVATPKQLGNYRYQLVDLDTNKFLLLSYKQNYTRKDAENECQEIIKQFKNPGYEEKYEIVSKPSQDGQHNYLAIVKGGKLGKKQTQRKKALPAQSIEEIVAIASDNAPASISKDNLLKKFQDGKVVYRLKQADNISGLERRVAALMGLDNWERRMLCFLEPEQLAEGGVYGFRLVDRQTNQILLESRSKNYQKDAAKSEGQRIIDKLKASWDNPDYQLRPLPYGFQTSEYIYSIGVVKNPNTEATLLATYPDTFGTETARNVRLEEIKNAIENNQVECEPVLAKVYGFQWVHRQTNSILLESRSKDYEKSAAKAEGQRIIDKLKASWDNPDYQLRSLPYGFQTSEYIYGIGVVKNPNTEATLLAIHPDTFGTETARNLRLEDLRNAIENNQVECKSIPADSIPFFKLTNDKGETILNGLMDRKKLEAMKTEEALNESLRLIGSEQMEYLFFVDSFQKEEYDFQIVRKEYHVANHPKIFRHKSVREKVRDQLFQHVANADDRELYTEFKHTLKEVSDPNNKKSYLIQLIDVHAPSGERSDIWWGTHLYEKEQDANQAFQNNFFSIIEAAREYDSYSFVECPNGKFDIYLNADVHGVHKKLKYPQSLKNREDAWRKADYLRQRARLYPVNCVDEEYVFFLYPNTPPPDFGTDWEREKRRKEWNLDWEDYKLWESVRTFSSPEAALLAFRGGPNNEPSDSPSFLTLLRKKSNYERTETSDELGKRDDIGPFNLEIVDPSKIVAVTPDTYRLVRDRQQKYKEVESFLFREGFHIVEHILLRPSIKVHSRGQFTYIEEQQTNIDNFLDQFNLCTGVNPADLPLSPEEYLPLSDPFSGWATVVLPFWPKRFQNMNFRKFFEQTLRREAPAHVALRIVWVDPDDMKRFEEHYKKWLTGLATEAQNLDELRDELMKILLQLENVYPEANLPGGIADSDTEGGVILDFTKLI